MRLILAATLAALVAVPAVIWADTPKSAALKPAPAKGIPAHGPLPHLLPRPRPIPAPPLTGTVAAAYEFLLTDSYPAAVGASDNLIDKDPKNAAAIAIKAYALAEFGSMDAARPLADKALDLTAMGPQDKAKALAFVAASAVADKDGQQTRALQAIQQAGNIDPALGLAYMILADQLHRAKRDDLARQVLKAGLQAHVTKTEAAALRGRLAAL